MIATLAWAAIETEGPPRHVATHPIERFFDLFPRSHFCISRAHCPTEPSFCRWVIERHKLLKPSDVSAEPLANKATTPGRYVNALRTFISVS